MKATMNNDFYETTASVIAGVCTALFGVFLSLDWHQFYVEILKSGQVLWLGVVGGIGGYLGKKLVHRIYNRKSKKG